MAMAVVDGNRYAVYKLFPLNKDLGTIIKNIGVIDTCLTPI